MIELGKPKSVYLVYKNQFNLDLSSMSFVPEIKLRRTVLTLLIIAMKLEAIKNRRERKIWNENNVGGKIPCFLNVWVEKFRKNSNLYNRQLLISNIYWYYRNKWKRKDKEWKKAVIPCLILNEINVKKLYKRKNKKKKKIDDIYVILF